MLKRYITFLLLCLPLLACNSGGESSDNSNSFVPAWLQAVPSDMVLRTVHHSDVGADKYYNSVTNGSNYIAFSVKTFNKVKISKLAIENNLGGTFAIVNESANYKVPQCISAGNMPAKAECSILVKLDITTQVGNESATLRLMANGVPYTKPLKKSVYAYVAGEFTQVYSNGSLQGIPPQSGRGGCGPNSNQPCLIAEYDFANNRLRPIATTNYLITDMAEDNQHNLYIAGGFTSFTHESEIIKINSDTDTEGMIIKYNPLTGKASNWITEIYGESGVNASGTVNVIEYDPNTNILYLSGGFERIGSYVASSGYPVLSYDLTANNGTFANVFGSDSNNPDLSVTGLAVESESLFISGYYTTISGQQYYEDDFSGNSFRLINMCNKLSGGVFTCPNGSGFWFELAIDPSDEYSWSGPATSIAIQPDGGVYAVGNFTYMYYALAADTTSYPMLGAPNGSFLLGFNHDPMDLFGYAGGNNWSNRAAAGNAPDNYINVITPYDDGKFYAGGRFSTIGGIAPDNNPGECGPDRNKSCLFAIFDGVQWKKIATTDGPVSVLKINAGISSD